MSWTLHVGDVEDVLATLEPESFSAVLCDPPYGLRFMSSRWDYDVPSVDAWRAILRVLKPGAPILACGGSRTYHRLVLNAEDAGAEIRDQIQWLYGSGFPKSLNLLKALTAAGWSAERIASLVDDGTSLDEYGTALKPAHEPIMLARKPLVGTLARNIELHGTGTLAIDACRVATDWSVRPESWKRSGHSAKPEAEKIAAPPGIGIDCNPLGRWPANVILDSDTAEELDAQSGILTSGLMKAGTRRRGTRSVAMGTMSEVAATADTRADSGGASRFFYTAKASRAEREAGIDAFPVLTGGELTGREDGTGGLNSPRSGAGRGGGRRNPHPTVKPIALMRYLARLVLPPGGGRILVPYAGVGSEMIGALLAGWSDVVGVEQESDYVQIARARIAHWAATTEAA